MHQVEAKLAEASRKCSQADRRLKDAETMEKKLHKEKLLFETEYDSCYFVSFLCFFFFTFSKSCCRACYFSSSYWFNGLVVVLEFIPFMVQSNEK